MTDLDERKAARAGLLKVRETRSIPFQGEIREAANGTGGTSLTFEGYACITDEGYQMQDWAGPYTEVVRSGAFTKTLAEGADVAFLINHEGMTLARTKSDTLTLTEDTTGLHTLASLDPARPDVAALRSAVERKDIDEMSFAFWVERQQWSPDWEQRDIIEVKLHQGDVSAVNFGANPHTGGSTSMRHRLPDGLTARAYALALSELRAGKLTDESRKVLAGMAAVYGDDIDPEQLAAALDPEPNAPPAPTPNRGDIDLLAARARVLALRA